jgi:hypothetical protein
VFENRLLRRTFGLKTMEMTGDLIKLHNDELHNLYPSPSIITGIKPKRMRWAGNFAHIINPGNGYKISFENLKTRDNIKDSDVVGGF